MKLEFSYSLKKDIENYKVASRSINNKQPTKMQALYVSKFGKVFEDQKLERFIADYIDTNKIDMLQETERIRTNWLPIENNFLEKSMSIFGVLDDDRTIHVFLTTDGRCSYNIEQRHFFVSVSRPLSRPLQNRTIMHELLHFWTWDAFHEEVESERITKKIYNDIKESLTELLNVEFADLLGEAHDDGYPQHKEIRLIIAKTWAETKNIHRTFEAALKTATNIKPL